MKTHAAMDDCDSGVEGVPETCVIFRCKNAPIVFEAPYYVCSNCGASYGEPDVPEFIFTNANNLSNDLAARRTPHSNVLQDRWVKCYLVGDTVCIGNVKDYPPPLIEAYEIVKEMCEITEADGRLLLGCLPEAFPDVKEGPLTIRLRELIKEIG